MSLKEKLFSDMKEAMKAKNSLRKNTIQLVRGAILLKEKNTSQEVSEEEILDIIIQEIKKRKDALVDFEKGHRQDLVEEANAEIDVLTTYLPKQLGAEEISQIVQQTIQEVEATSLKDMGKVMSILTPKLKGKADTGQVSSIVKKCLTK